jgi:phage terminase small subunit
MNSRHAQFVQEYLADPDLNATRAYQRVYPRSTADAARRSASQLLTRPDISAAVAERRKARSLSTQITAERVLLEIARLALADHRKLYHPDGRLKAVHELDDDTAATIASSEVEEESSGTQTVVRIKKVKQWDKREALNMLGKHLGLFLERLKLEGEVKTTPAPLNLSALTHDQLLQFRGLLAAAAQPSAGPVPGATPPAG